MKGPDPPYHHLVRHDGRRAQAKIQFAVCLQLYFFVDAFIADIGGDKFIGTRFQVLKFIVALLIADGGEKCSLQDDMRPGQAFFVTIVDDGSGDGMLCIQA